MATGIGQELPRPSSVYISNFQVLLFAIPPVEIKRNGRDHHYETKNEERHERESCANGFCQKAPEPTEQIHFLEHFPASHFL